jgi:hypothetical protein
MPLINPRLDALFVSKVTQLTTDLSKKYVVQVELTTNTQCPNCNYDVTGKCGSGIYNGSGGQPFEKVCPVCRNNGKVQTITLQQIIANAKIGEAKTGDQPIAEGDLPEGHARIKGLYTDVALLEAATAFYIDGVRYDRLGQLYSRGLQTKVSTIITLKRSD